MTRTNKTSKGKLFWFVCSAARSARHFTDDTKPVLLTQTEMPLNGKEEHSSILPGTWHMHVTYMRIQKNRQNWLRPKALFSFCRIKRKCSFARRSGRRSLILLPSSNLQDGEGMLGAPNESTHRYWVRRFCTDWSLGADEEFKRGQLLMHDDHPQAEPCSPHWHPLSPPRAMTEGRGSPHTWSQASLVQSWLPLPASIK